MRFDHDDEDAATAAREALVERFGGWLDARPEHRGAHAWDADYMLNWKWGYADGDYGTWTRADVDEFLLEHAPRKLSASADKVASIPQSIGAFMYFLEEAGLLSTASDPAESIAFRALAQERSFLDAMDDPANFGMAKRLFTSAGFDGDDILDQSALDDAMAQFNALSFEERGLILGLEAGKPAAAAPAFELPALPVRAVPSPDELDATARDVVLLRRVDALHAALGPTGIKLTKAGNPTVADGKRLVELVGVTDPVDGIRSSADLRELFAVGQVAQGAGAVEAPGPRFRAVDGWTSDEPAARWRRVVDAALDTGAATLQFGAAQPMPLQLAATADAAALHFLAMLWIAGEPLLLATLEGFLAEAAVMDSRTRRIAGFTAEWRASICHDRVRDVFATLTAAGVVEVVDGAATITDAGAWAVAPVLADAGFGVVEPDDISALGPDELIELLVARDDDVEILVPLWVAGRDPAAVAGAVVEALVANPEPMRVVLGFHVLGQLGSAASDAVAAARDTAIGAQAWLFLADEGVIDPSDVPREMVIQAGIELFLATSELGSPADVVEALFRGEALEDHARLIDEFAGSDHPRAGDVLELLGRHHPEKPLAKHARKAAHRWRSATGTSR